MRFFAVAQNDIIKRSVWQKGGAEWQNKRRRGDFGRLCSIRMTG